MRTRTSSRRYDTRQNIMGPLRHLLRLTRGRRHGLCLGIAHSICDRGELRLLPARPPAALLRTATPGAVRGDHEPKVAGRREEDDRICDLYMTSCSVQWRYSGEAA